MFKTNYTNNLVLPVCFGDCPYKIDRNGFKCNKKILLENEIELIKEDYKYD